MLSLQLYRRKPKGLPDLLNYAALVDSGIIQQKDGSLLAGFFFRGEDVQSATVDRMNQIGERVNTAFMRFGDGWAHWIEANRLETQAYSPPDASHFPDTISALIDAERRAHFQREGRHFEGEYALLVMYTPPRVQTRKMVELMYDDDGQAEKPADVALRTFRKQLDELMDNLSDALRIRRMGAYTVEQGEGAARQIHMRDELVNYLHNVLTGETDEINIPAPAMYLDAYIGGQELWAGDTPKIGTKYIAVVAIEGFPSSSYPGILEMLNHLAIPYRFSTRMIYLDLHQALAELNKYRRKWAQKVRGFVSQVIKTSGGTINQDALLMTDETDAAITDANSGLVSFGFYTPVIVLMSEDRGELLENARIVAREIRREGFATRVETVNAMEAWLGSLPGHPYPNVRRPLINTLALSDMLPLFSVWPGRAENPCPLYEPHSPPLLQGATTGATPFRLNLHTDDVGHTLVFGPTGAGKSVLLNTLMASHLRYANATITGFDKGNSMLALCLATGGQHYAPGSDAATLGFCPLKHIDTDADLAWASEWLETLYRLASDEALTAEQRGAIHAALENMRENGGSRTLTDFTFAVQDRKVREALGHYCVTGPLRGLLDSEDDTLSESHFAVFEMEDLLNMGDKNAIPVLLYLFRRFEKRLKGQPALLVLDEAWIMLGHPVFREKIREWLKVLRKANCAVIIATQSLSDAVKSGLVDVLNESCPTKIFLPNPQARDEGPSALYEGFGLNPRQIELLAQATRKRDYYYTSPEGQRLFTLELGPIALSFVAAASKEDVQRIRELHREHGRNWPFKWLQSRRVSFEKYLPENDYEQAA